METKKLTVETCEESDASAREALELWKVAMTGVLGEVDYAICETGGLQNVQLVVGMGDATATGSGTHQTLAGAVHAAFADLSCSLFRPPASPLAAS